MGMQMPMFTGANQQVRDLLYKHLFTHILHIHGKVSYHHLCIPSLSHPSYSTPCSFAKSNDDVDLHDIFADYLSETDLAPQFDQQTQHQQQFTNLQTAQQLELAANAVAAEFQAQQQQQLSLPTGGIKTSWHSGGLPNMQQGGGDGEPHPKRSRGEDLYLPTGQQQQVQQQQQQQQQQQNGFNLGAIGGGVTQQQLALAQAASGVGGLSNRLGFTLPNMNNNSGTTVDISNLMGQQQKQQGEVNIPTQQATLPIGMGLKFGAGGQVIMTNSMNVNNNVMNNASASNGTTALATSQQARLLNQQQPNIAVSNMKYTTPSNTISQLGLSKKEIEAQMAEERRLRNREHAKRSRVRKKFMLESLQQQVRGLQDENSTLRQLVQTYIPQKALQIIDECCSKSVLFGTDGGNDGGAGAGPQDPAKETPLLKSDFSLIESLTAGQQNFVLSDPRLPDNPIVFASAGFYAMTGYTRDQVLGRNCRFLQGAGTDRKAIDVIRTAVANGTDATVCLLNYKADGTPFWNQLFIAALRDADNCIVNYVSCFVSVARVLCHLYSVIFVDMNSSYLIMQPLCAFLQSSGWSANKD